MLMLHVYNTRMSFPALYSTAASFFRLLDQAGSMMSSLRPAPAHHAEDAPPVLDEDAEVRARHVIAGDGGGYCDAWLWSRS